MIHCLKECKKKNGFYEGKSVILALVYFHIGFIIESMNAISSSVNLYLA